MSEKLGKPFFVSTDWLFVRSILCILGGILLWLYPSMLAQGLVMGTGILLIVSGIISLIISYNQNRGNTFFYLVVSGAVLLIILGILFVLKSGFFAQWFVFVIGIMVIVLAVLQLIEIINMRKYEIKSSALAFLSPILLFIFGIVIVVHPASINNIIGIIAAIALIYYGVVGIILAFRTRKLIKEKEHLVQQEWAEAEELTEDKEENHTTFE